MAVMPSTSSEYLHVPVTVTPAGTDLSSAAVRIAVVAHAATPASADWRAASWSGATARLMVGAGSELPLVAGDYRVWINIDPPGGENVVRQAGMLSVV